eukprot:TRINITY_DN13356_c0_g1_i1.p1 TRINITY_DN13356_c0_g1~~TRINITY_DN13356_c0_g1_i1.p1  ORF type:complete len:218 (-),score=36.38 TRINITY_DN13356_c0_g1_i1:56-688(-)
MADQMVGNWYSISCGLGRIIPMDKVKTVLSNVYNMNILAISDGKLGAINGVRPDGSIDTSCLHSQEMTPSVTYGVAAAMLQAGLTEEAFKLISDFTDNSYNNLGCAFQTPHCFSVSGQYRGSTHMSSSLSIWAFQWCYEIETNKNLSGENHLASEMYNTKLEKSMAEKVAYLSEMESKKQMSQKQNASESQEGILKSVRTKVTRSLSLFM